MRRERRCCGLFRTGKIIASYSLDSAQSDNEVQPGMVIHPVEAHRRISHWYTEMINLGHGHDEVLEELERQYRNQSDVFVEDNQCLTDVIMEKQAEELGEDRFDVEAAGDQTGWVSGRLTRQLNAGDRGAGEEKKEE